MSAAVTVPPFQLDSSVLVRRYHDEEHPDLALQLRLGYQNKTCEIRLADLSFYELVNTLHCSAKYSSQDIFGRAQLLYVLESKIYSFDALVLWNALELSSEKNLPSTMPIWSRSPT